jgi:VWFA-related protein
LFNLSVFKYKEDKGMKVKRLIFLMPLIALLAGHLALTQESKRKTSQQEQEIPRPAYEIEVIVTNVDVVVTDKKGNRVFGLKPENFELYEDGLLQKLTNFYEVKGMDVYTSSPDREREKLVASPQPLAKSFPRFRNKIIFYFDNWHLHPLNRNWSIKRLESFINNNFSIEDNSTQGMVVCLDQKLDLVQDFTSNSHTLLQAIGEVKERSGQALLQQRTRESLKKELNDIVTNTGSGERLNSYERAMGIARNFVEAAQGDLMFSLKSMNAFLDYLTGIEGKKILIYVSDGLPLNPSEEVFAFIDQAFPFGNARNEALNYDETRLFKELTAKCNANEISIYPINAQGLESMILSADKAGGWNTYSRGSGMSRIGARFKNEALKLMANDTGGIAVLETNDIESGLERIENDLQFYYSLGYVSPHREDNRYHSIEVKLVGLSEKYDIRLRQGYTRLSQEEKIKESVFSRLYLRRLYNPTSIMIQIMPVELIAATEKLRLTLKLLLPIKNLTLLPQENDYRGQIKVYIALMDSEGKLSGCHELSELIKIPAKDYEVALKSNYPYLAEMYVDPGHYTISLAVRDVPGGVVNYLQFERTIKKQ